jgi:uncharacterized protein (DUF1778 family)
MGKHDAIVTIRIPEADKEALVAAAELAGQTLSTFMRDAALAKAKAGKGTDLER